MRLFTALLLLPILHARPAVEPVSPDSLNHAIRATYKTDTALNPLRLAGNERITTYASGDIAFIAPYSGQSIAKGDVILYLSSQTGKPIIREIATTTPLKTTRNFTVPTDKILGIVQRVMRVK